MAGSRRAGITITRWEVCPEGDGYYLAFVASSKALFQTAVLAVKSLHPHDRQWCPDVGCWWIHAEAVEELAERLVVLRDLLHDRQRGHRDEAPRPAGVPADIAEAFAELHLTPSAPPELVAAARRVLTKMHHPDVAGGDLERMKRLNVAGDIIEAWMQARRRSA